MSTIKSKIDRQNKEQYSYQKMLSYGWTPTQASAIVGNLKHESGFRTDVEGDKGYKGGSSFGIAQFRGARLVSLKNTYGNNWKDLDNQLEFVNEELKTTHKKAGDRLRKATTIYDAGRIVSDDYEIPALKWNANDSRQSAVFDTYRKYSGLKLTQQEEIELLQGTTERMMSNYNQTQKPKTNTPTTPIPEISNLQSVPELSNLADDKEQEEEESQNARAVLQQKKNEQNFISELIKSSQIQYIDPNQVEDYTQEQPQEEFRNGGEIPVSSQGVYDFPEQEVIVPTNNGRITMSNVNYPILGTDELGNQQMMYPNKEYKFQGKIIHEIPQIKNRFKNSAKK